MFKTSDKAFKGTWAYQAKSAWESNLENCLYDVLDETGLSEEKLYQIMEVLHENRVIS